MAAWKFFFVGIAALLCVLAQGKKYFGYYEAILSETAAYSNIYQSSSLADAVFAKHTYNITSLLLVLDTFFTFIPNRLILRNDWQQSWATFAQQAEPLLANHTIIGFNLGDELVWNCLAPENLTIVANAVRERFPRGRAIIWYNEATPPLSQDLDSCGHTHLGYKIPTTLDWFSTDIYHMDGVAAGWVNQWVRGFYDQYIFPHLSPGQQVILVPGAFGSDVNHYPNGTYICNRSCYDTMCAYDAQDFATWAANDARVVGVFPWNYNGCPTCNGSRWTPPHTCCMDELGARVQPITCATWQRIASEWMD
eukprot:m.99664 g.99664  ORF g.99664 m.99664 type:complete len:308 (+) comp14040_c0_seq1:39-962(+)